MSYDAEKLAQAFKAIEHCMHRADRGRVHVRIKLGQSFPDLRGAPARLVLL